MPILWIIINPIDLWYLLIIYLIIVKLDLELDVAFIFAYKITTINSMAMARFFHIIYKAVLLSLFTSEYYNRGLLRLISIYFITIKINGCGMVYLYCLF